MLAQHLISSMFLDHCGVYCVRVLHIVQQLQQLWLTTEGWWVRGHSTSGSDLLTSYTRTKIYRSCCWSVLSELAKASVSSSLRRKTFWKQPGQISRSLDDRYVGGKNIHLQETRSACIPSTWSVSDAYREKCTPMCTDRLQWKVHGEMKSA